ncbi:tail protein X [Lachnoanaerobaculum sp. Marseille-Q4761]|uniref:tail protein X n=1 Tax=Lachnoanaerobaculum sp. Marseille-Q4761 TaxID=2819511 RepID=UPI001AA0D647|nr:tail protein X [Lachnoanaerobaculum sp. Marseille-Q4761]MBO1870072.1 tail protein X [Lachnoanaerobaculum sp. Marseille-Q4761]
MKTYTTVQGQTWDQIAYELYGNEYMCDKIMELNRDKLDCFVFPAGIELTVPDKADAVSETVTSDYPAWRAMLNAKI